jgi:hypothetical protein
MTHPTDWPSALAVLSLRQHGGGEEDLVRQTRVRIGASDPHPSPIAGPELVALLLQAGDLRL